MDPRMQVRMPYPQDYYPQYTENDQFLRVPTDSTPTNAQTTLRYTTPRGSVPMNGYDYPYYDSPYDPVDQSIQMDYQVQSLKPSPDKGRNQTRAVTIANLDEINDHAKTLKKKVKELETKLRDKDSELKVET